MKKSNKEYIIIVVAVVAVLISFGILLFTNSFRSLFTISNSKLSAQVSPTSLNYVGTKVWPVKNANLYQSYSGTTTTGKTVPAGTQLTIKEFKNSRFKVTYNNINGYINAKDCMIDMITFDTRLDYQMPNASKPIYTIKNNSGEIVTLITQKLYKEKIAALMYDTALKLSDAENIAESKGYKIVVYDAYRPKSVTKKLYEEATKLVGSGNSNNYPIGNLLAQNVSTHNYGIAVDISLKNKSTGKLLSMPTSMHFIDNNAGNMNDNSKKLQDIMAQAGMDILKGSSGRILEWWHYQNNGSTNATEKNIIEINTITSSTNSAVGAAVKKELTLSATREALEKGESITLTANQQVTWTSSNKKVATADNKGKVKAVNYGTATITAKSKDGATKKVLLYIGENIDISKNYGPNVTISTTTDNKNVYVTEKDNNTIDYIVIRENNSKGTIINQTYTKEGTQLKIKLTKLPDVGSKLRYYITTKDKSSNVSSYTFTVQNTNGKYTVNNGPQLENANVKLMEVNNNKYLFFRFADSNGITKVQYSTNNKTYKTVNLTGEKYATYYIKLSDIPKDKEGVYTVYLSSTDKGDNVTRKQKLEFKIR